MKQLIYIIILLGVVGCQDSRPSVSVELTPNHGWRVLINNDPKHEYRILQNWDGIEYGLYIKDKTEAIEFAKRFDTWEKINRWQDSIKAINNPSLVKPEVHHETIIIY